MSESNKDYKHDNVAVTINDQKVDIPQPSQKDIENTNKQTFLTSIRDGKKYSIEELHKLYNIYGSYNKVSKETGISDKTIKRHLTKSPAPVYSTTPSVVAKEQYPNRKKVTVMSTKASKMMNQWFKENRSELSDAMDTLLVSITDPTVIARAPLRDRAVAFGIVTERLQKAEELEIRRQDSAIKQAQLTYKEREMDLEKRRVAALEKGITVNVGRQFHDVSDILPVNEQPNGGSENGK